jgi:hypothetical protein
LAGYRTNVLECISPLGVNVMLPGDEKENLAACIDMDFVEEILAPQRRVPVSFDSLINLVCVLPHR